MKYVAVDTETHLIEPGVFAPKLVCVSFYSNKDEVGLFLKDPGVQYVKVALERGYGLVGANFGFDVAACSKHDPELFSLFVDAYREGRIWDVQVAQKLLDIETGCRKFNRYALGVLAKRFTDLELDKTEDSWRLRYAELDGIPVEQWPPEARQYAEQDAEATWKVFLHQQPYFDEDLREQLAERCRFDLSLYYMSREGMGVAEKPVHELETKVLGEIAALEPELIAEGFLKDRNAENTGKVNPFTGEVAQPEWGKDTKGIEAKVLELYKEDDPLFLPKEAKTEKDNIRTDGAFLEETGHPPFVRFAEYAKLISVRNKDLVFLKQGLIDGRVHTRFDTLKDSGRSSSSDPNLQNLSRQPGVRECFVPGVGMVYLDVDWSSAELHTLAQVCLTVLGYSTLAEALNKGLDPHIMMAQRLAGVSDYEEMKAHPRMKHFRQIAKPVNFGLPGGMGPVGLTIYAKAMGVDLEEVGFPAEVLIAAWHEQWPEMADYFAWIRKQIPNIVLPGGSCRRRQVEFFTEGSNYPFQGLAADGAALAAWALFEACYVQKDNLLFGSKPVMFVHDQFILESKDDDLIFQKLQVQCDIMEREFNKIVPDVPCGVEGEVKRVWTK